MKRIRLRTVVMFSLAGLSGAMLLYTSQNVQQAEHELRAIKASIRQEEESIRVLNAEWAALNSPERIEELASEYLRLAPASPGQMLAEPSVLPDAVKQDDEQALMHRISQPAAPSGQKSLTPVPAHKPAAPAKPQGDSGDINRLLEKMNPGGGQ